MSTLMLLWQAALYCVDSSVANFAAAFAFACSRCICCKLRCGFCLCMHGSDPVHFGATMHSAASVRNGTKCCVTWCFSWICHAAWYRRSCLAQIVCTVLCSMRMVSTWSPFTLKCCRLSGCYSSCCTAVLVLSETHRICDCSVCAKFG